MLDEHSSTCCLNINNTTVNPNQITTIATDLSTATTTTTTAPAISTETSPILTDTVATDDDNKSFSSNKTEKPITITKKNSSTSISHGPIRLKSIVGYDGRINDISYCYPLNKPKGSNDIIPAVIYFGGDVQDYPEIMEHNRDSMRYVRYNLDSTAMLLRNNYPNSHIVIIKAVRREFRTFSCYDNFVRGNTVGIPDHTPMNYALNHLEELLENVSFILRKLTEADIFNKTLSHVQTMKMKTAFHEMDADLLQVGKPVADKTEDSIIYPCVDDNDDDDDNDNENGHSSYSIQPLQISDAILEVIFNATKTKKDVTTSNASTQTMPFNDYDNNTFWWQNHVYLDKSKLTLIGFSKGCVVLNQFLYEFHYLKTLTPDDSTMMRLVSRIKDIYWLDGGHGGSKNIWITSRSLLETLTRLDINIHIHVTPYQVEDERRPWIGKEEKIFSALLRVLGAPFIRQIHFNPSNIKNLYTHFDLLLLFNKKNQQHFKMLEQHKLQQQEYQQLQLQISNNNNNNNK